MATTVDMDTKIGGKNCASSTLESDMTEDDLIKRAILAYDPLRMIACATSAHQKDFR
jgi:hypothetical protein